jgi:hypothetical protein
MVLVFDGCEVSLQIPGSRRPCPRKFLRIRPRSDITTAEIDNNGQMKLNRDDNGDTYILPAVVLAPLRVNKQFFNEAMPVFYAKNVFAYDCLQGLYRFLQRTPIDRRNCIRHLNCAYLTHRINERDTAARCFKLMKDMQSLRNLGINLDEPDRNFSYSYYHSLPPWIKQPLKLPGIYSLSRLRLEEVNIFGECPNYRAFLAQMVKPKGKDAPKKPARKRKPKKLTVEANQNTIESDSVSTNS